MIVPHYGPGSLEKAPRKDAKNVINSGECSMVTEGHIGNE